MTKTRVLVVDDSAFARKVMREVLSKEADLEVIDIARDGGDALEKIAALSPDVITLDLMMPVVDGIGVLRALGQMPQPPRVVVVSTSGADTELGIEALDLGAVALVEKPTSLATERLYALGDELVRAVRIAAVARPRRPDLVPPSPPVTRARPLTAPPPAVARSPYTGRTEVLVVGASTGGPPAIARLLATLPADFPVPIAAVVHLPVEYTAAFARRLDATTAFRVEEASDGLPLDPGRVVLARGGIHLGLARRDDHVVATLRPGAAGHVHVPAVDVLFQTAAKIYGAGALGLVLTGMGNDGTAGARAIRAAGGRTLTESESSCVVYGMPRAVSEAGLSDGDAPLEDLAALIMRSL